MARTVRFRWQQAHNALPKANGEAVGRASAKAPRDPKLEESCLVRGRGSPSAPLGVSAAQPLGFFVGQVKHPYAFSLIVKADRDQRSPPWRNLESRLITDKHALLCHYTLHPIA